MLTAVAVCLTVGLFSTSFFAVKADRSAVQLRQALYRARMNLVPERLRAGDTVGAQQLLAHYREGSAEAHLRDFGWYHFSGRLSCVQLVVDHGENLEAVSIAHDGRVFATAGSQGQVRVWNADDGRLVRILEHSRDNVTALDFSPQDDRLLSATAGGLLQIWNPVINDRAAVELNPVSPISCARFSPDRHYIVSGSALGSVVLWSVGQRKEETREFSPEVASLAAPVIDVAFSPDSTRLAVLYQEPGDRPVKRTLADVWEIETRKKLCTLPRIVTGQSIEFDSTGETIIVVSRSGTLHRHQVDDGALVARQTTPTPFGMVRRLGIPDCSRPQTSMARPTFPTIHCTACAR